MEHMHPYLLALLGSCFTFFMTALGASIVFFIKKTSNNGTKNLFMGFAAGVMIAASVWSLLIPAIEQSEHWGKLSWFPAALGFVIGYIFIYFLEIFISRYHSKKETGTEVNRLSGSKMMMFAVTIHNIPEGMAVGLTFALASSSNTVTFASAIALAVGIGIQNFPEGAAISLPLRQEGMSKWNAFKYGALSGAVEPIGAVITVLLVGTVEVLLPWFLAFAAGVMIHVVVDELIPEAHANGHSNMGTMGVMLGFVVMMILDVALG